MQPQSHISIDQVKFSQEFELRLEQRFGKKIEDLRGQFKYIKVANHQVRHAEIQKKFRNPVHAGMKYFYHEAMNMFFPVCPRTKVAATVLFLDGRFGYNF
jgi:hypothetical protein